MFKINSFNLYNRCFNQFLKVRYINNRVKNHVEKQIQKEILQKYLGISYQRSASLIRNHNILKTIDNKRMEETIKSLNRMGISADDIFKHPMSLTLHQLTIEHNIKYLQEVGFTHISAQILLKFRSVVKKPIILLKAHGVIPDDINVPERMYSYLYPKSDNFPTLQNFTDEDTIIHVHETIFKHYLVWRFKTTIDEVDRMFKIYEKYKYKSFNLISQTIQILKEDLHFQDEKILHNGYLLQNGPDYLKQIIESFPKLAGVDIKTILYKYPKIIAGPPSNISAIDKHLRNFGITDEAIKKCFEIYTLAPDTILHRLNELKHIPEFEVLTKNVRIVSLIFNQNKAKLRLDHLQKLKVKCASINVLCGSDAVFEKYSQEGNDRTKGSDLINYICLKLGLSEKIIRQKLSKNPNWCHVPVISIQRTLNYLVNKGFSKLDIKEMPIILVYPKKQITDALHEVENNPKTQNLKLNPVTVLNLCIYFIERKHHFSGDGLWDNLPIEAA